MPTQTVCRLLLGHELRRAREDAGKTPSQAADLIGNVTTKISRVELGQSGIGKADLTLLLGFYDVASDHRLLLFELANIGRRRWTGHREAFPAWFRMYVDLEEDADLIRSTHVETLPSLLATQDYLHFCHNGYTDAHKLRHRILVRANPPECTFILSESCLRHLIGGPAVMHNQLLHLLKLSRLHNVAIQVLPFTAGRVIHPFTLLRIPAPGAAHTLEFAYLPELDNARYRGDPDSLARHHTAWTTLQASTLSPAESRKFITEIADQLALALS